MEIDNFLEFSGCLMSSIIMVNDNMSESNCGDSGQVVYYITIFMYTVFVSSFSYDPHNFSM